MGFLAHLLEPHPNGTVTDPERLCDVPQTCALGFHDKDAVAVNDPPWTAKLFPMGTGVPQSCGHLSFVNDNSNSAIAAMTANINLPDGVLRSMLSRNEVLLAVEPDSVLLTDDLIQGDLAVASFGVCRSWTHAFLVHLRRKGKISQERFAEAVAKLIGMQYTNTPFNSAELLACARLAKNNLAAWPFVQVGSPRCCYCFALGAIPSR